MLTKLISFRFPKYLPKIHLLNIRFKTKNIQPDLINKITQPFKNCLNQKYFTFKNKYYLQKEVLQIGNPIRNRKYIHFLNLNIIHVSCKTKYGLY